MLAESFEFDSWLMSNYCCFFVAFLHFLLSTMSQVTVTERPGHAYDVVTSMSSGELNSYDGIVAVVSLSFVHWTFLICPLKYLEICMEEKRVQ